MKAILFSIPDSVTQAGSSIRATCHIRVTEDIPNATILKKLTHRCYSKVISKKQIPYDPLNPQMILETDIAKNGKIDISMESTPETKKKYELVNDDLRRVLRKYGEAPKYEKEWQIYCGTLKRGDYKFPADVETLPSFPSSFSYRQEDGLKVALVSYKLSVIVLTNSDLYHSATVDVYINRQEVPRAIKQTSEGNIIQFICFNRGTVELSMFLDKNVFQPGEKIKILYAMDNSRSQRAIDRVEIRIVTKLTLIDESYEEDVVEKRIAQTNSFGGINPGTREDCEKHIELPKDLKATINTEFIRYQVFLQIEAIADAHLTFMSVPALIQVPIFIQESRVTRPEPNLAGWSFTNYTSGPVLFSNMEIKDSVADNNNFQSQLGKKPQVQNYTSDSYVPLPKIDPSSVGQ